VINATIIFKSLLIAHFKLNNLLVYRANLGFNIKV
jgi:hypothetical protein